MESTCRPEEGGQQGDKPSHQDLQEGHGDTALGLHSRNESECQFRKVHNDIFMYFPLGACLTYFCVWFGALNQ